MNLIKTLFLTLTLLALSASAMAWGPETGSRLPDDFTLVNADGKTVKLEDISGEKGATLAFVRSLDWCPFCMRQARELNDHAEAFSAVGYPVVTISYDSPAQLASFADQHDIEIPLLSDTESRLIMALDILNENYQPGDRGYGIPEPGIMVVNKAGVVQATFAEPGYKERPRPEMVLETLNALP